MLELREVSKKVGAASHIADVSLLFEDGSLNVLLGPTLSGKTSLMRLMAGLDQPSSGRILVDGRDVTGVPVRRRNVAMVYQQFINYPTLSVYENIASPLRVAGVDRRAVDRRVRQAAELMRLDRELERKPLELSGGQQQRTALARALVKDASLVLLDEPLANLDYKLREELRAELPRLFAETGAILVYATAEPSEALLLGGETATLAEGRVTQFGRTIEVYRRPHDLTTAMTFSDPPLNTMQVEKRGGLVRLADGREVAAGGQLAGLADGAYLLGFRPHRLHLSRTRADAIVVQASVAVTEITGSESFVHVDTPDGVWVGLIHGIRPFEVGAPVEIFLDPDEFLVFSPEGRAVAAPLAAAA
ncbi:MAG TPA: ABC transporter ATP-binding protein [Devosiaceae bacterium]|nr:ABC transporter ATP-binding protein [Devosiaceae bacterium]